MKVAGRLILCVLLLNSCDQKKQDRKDTACTPAECLLIAERLDIFSEDLSDLPHLDTAKNSLAIKKLQQELIRCNCASVGYGATPVFPESEKLHNEVYDSLPLFTSDSLWNIAINERLGIIGNDFRGREDIGTAAIEREFKGSAIGNMLDLLGASNINFWYPQKRNKEKSCYKKTLSGTVRNIYAYENEDILPDRDLNIEILPAENYTYLVTEAHRPELNTITRFGQQQNKEAVGCPQKFTDLEAEIDLRTEARQKLLELIKEGQSIVAYGPWVYDKGHCCKPEIHPAEQIWWSTDSPRVQSYFLNLFCDASKRYWYTADMDGDYKRPWAEPPLKGKFAIAFELIPGRPAKKFEVFTIEKYNAGNAGSNKTYNLVYQKNTVLSFIANSDHFKVSFENVGLSGNKIRGFLVLETSVGKLKQFKTEIRIPHPLYPDSLMITKRIPENANPDSVDRKYLDRFFEKEEGHLMIRLDISAFGTE